MKSKLIPLFIVVILVMIGAVNRLSVRAQPPTANPFSSAERQSAPGRDFDLIHVALDLTIDYPKLSFQGVVVNTLVPLRDHLTHVKLYCGANLNVESTAISGIKAPFTREGDFLTITPAAPLRGKKAVRVTIRYSNIVGKENRNFYWVKPTSSQPQRIGFWTRGGTVGNRQWLPTWDYPNDFATSETRVTVPADWSVIGNGDLVSNNLNANQQTRTFHWRMHKPHATYLISLVGAPLSIKKAVWRGVPLMYVVPKGSEHLIDDTFSDTPDMLSFFSDILGVKYPWSKYAQTAIANYSGAQENISATSLNATYLTERRKGYRNYAGVGSHELAHQWFGDLVSPKEWGHLWLSEGFATFFRYLYMEHSRGSNDYTYQIKDNEDFYLSESRLYRRPLVTNRYPSPSSMFDNHTYQKGAAVLHTLRRFMGDRNFFRGLRRYLLKYRHQPADTEDLRRAMTEATGIDLKPFFDQWIYKPGHPVLDYTWQWDAGSRQAVINVKQLQDTGDGTPVYELEMNIGVITDNRLVRRKIRLNLPEQKFRIPLEKKPEAVILDPDHDFLCEIPKLHWSRDELPAILRFAPNAVGRQEAMKQMLAGTPSDEFIKITAEAVREDTNPFPAFRSITALGELRRPELRSLFSSQLAHPNDDRRVQAIRALGRLAVNPTDADAVRSLINDRSPYAVVLEAVSTLSAWDAAGNRSLFEQSLKAPWPDNKLRLEALHALRQADAAEGKAPLDPEPEMTRRLMQVWSDYAHGVKDSPNMSVSFSSRTSPSGDVGYKQYIRELRSASFIVRDDVSSLNQVSNGEPIKYYYYYKIVTGDRVIYLRFFVTPDGKVNDLGY